MEIFFCLFSDGLLLKCGEFGRLFCALRIRAVSNSQNFELKIYFILFHINIFKKYV